MDALKVNFVYSGLFLTDSEWTHPLRREITWEIIYVTEGEVHIREEETEYHLAKGDVLILEAGKEHAGTRHSFGRTSFFWLHFSTENFDALGITSPVIRGFSEGALFRKLLHVSNTSAYPDYAADALLLSLLSELARACTDSGDSTPTKIISEAAEWVKINSDKNLTVSDVAAHFSYNGEYLSKAFKKVYGMPLKKYIYDMRMRTARDMLCNTSLSVKEIAVRLGFESENRFAHFFKYHQKQSPTAFRNSSFNILMNKR